MGKEVHDTALTVDELNQRAVKARTLLAGIRALFPEAHGLAKDDRRLSQGKMGAVALAGYEIAKPISKRNEAIRGKIVKALDFYGGRALAAAATRRANASKGPKGGGLILIFRG